MKKKTSVKADPKKKAAMQRKLAKLQHRLKKLERFEADHLNLVDAVNEISLILARIGI